MSADTPKRLGRGLEALLATARHQRESATLDDAAAPLTGLKTIAIADIRANPFQPRRAFKEEELQELRSSLHANGLLQPITVRPNGGSWELVAGERRLRAATQLGWTEIPALVRDLDDRAMLTLALVENLQRADLNAIEEAEGYQRLINEFKLTQQQVAEAVGKDRTTITNLLRLLALPVSVRLLLEAGKITNGHARALLAIKNPTGQEAAAQLTLARQWSVRELEAYVRRGASPVVTPFTRNSVAAAPPTATQHSSLRRIEEQLRRRLQTDVTVSQSSAERGAVSISFYGPEDLDRLTDLLLGTRSDFE